MKFLQKTGLFLPEKQQTKMKVQDTLISKPSRMEKLFFNEKLMLSVVLLNVIVVFLQECGIESVMLNVIDIVCSAVFVVEMVVKHVVLGAKDYWRDGWNVLDGTVTIDTTDSLWITFYCPDLRWPAASCRYTGSPNSNWVTELVRKESIFPLLNRARRICNYPRSCSSPMP